MKKVIIGLLAVCMATVMTGCGDKNNSATQNSAAPEATMLVTKEPDAAISPEADNYEATDDFHETDTNDEDENKDDLSDDIKDGVDHVGDGVKDAVDGVNGAIDDTVDGVDSAVGGDKDNN